ncbi:hypothetical protein B0H12DRAFT_1067243 [Mycena haematopus]|nr:hypothetical protein B0H12DRAFT_1067243 [Mycena haematopus]
MDHWFFEQAGGYESDTGPIDRRLYPNSRVRDVHIWASAMGHNGEPTIIAGFAALGRLQVRELLQFLTILFDVTQSAHDWVIVEAKGDFFESPGTGGQVSDFEAAVQQSKNQPVILNGADERIVPAGHYLYFKRLSRTRMASETPDMKDWPLSSRTVTAPGSVKEDVGGSTTPNRNDTLRQKRRELDGRCLVTGRIALDRDKPRGRDWVSLHSAHVFPLAWCKEPEMKEMFGTDGFKLVRDHILHEKDGLVNTILMDARVHGWFDDYRFGIWPVKDEGKWYGKIFRFEKNGCEVDEEWLLAPMAQARFLQPDFGRQEPEEQRVNRETEEQARKTDRTRFDLTEHEMLRQLLKIHFETCLHWHVKGMGWDK